MKKSLLISASIATAVLSGCAIQPSSFQSFQAKDLTELAESGFYEQKTDHFFVINDSSGSMDELYSNSIMGSGSKHAAEKELLSRMNKTIPNNIKLTSGLRNFGFGSCHKIKQTTLQQPVSTYSKSSFDAAINSLTCASGGTPLNRPLSMAKNDLTTANGNIAVIVFSDGKRTNTSPIPAAKALKVAYGDRLCIYSVWVGNDKDAIGRNTLNEISDISSCGFSISGADISSSEGMATFVKNVFFQAVPVVIAEGDMDLDGVLDSKDQCPNTPLGATVNYQGCWVIKGVHFDTDKSNIKRKYYGILNNVATVIKRNSGLNIEVQGHTDNQGSAAYNLKLSDRRAKAVKAYLNRNIGNAGTLSAQGYGLAHPVDTNDTAEGRAHNRRVQLKILR